MQTYPAGASSVSITGRNLDVSDASLEWLKWIAVGAMFVDHINWFVIAGGFDPQSTAHAWMNDVGRLAFPLFAFVFGINLQRVLESPNQAERFRRMAWRLGVAAAAAQVPYWVLRGYFFPLNVLCTFALSMAVVLLWRRGSWPLRAAAVVSLVIGGFVVEYWWIGAALVFGAVAYARHRTVASLSLFTAMLLPLSLLNGNPYAFASIVAIAATVMMQPTRLLPRVPGLLYVVYAGHLWVLLGLVVVLNRLV